MRFRVEVGDRLRDRGGNDYEVLEERVTWKGNTHSQYTPVQFLCRDIGRDKTRWISHSTMQAMYDNKSLEITT